MKKLLIFIIPVFIFLAVLFYLHQKVQIYVQAYKLGNNYRRYRELVDKRDSCIYSFAKEVSISKVNHWAEKQNFVSVDRERVLALNVNREEPRQNRLASLVNRVFNISTPDTALAKE